MHNLSVLVVFNLNKLSLAVLEECIHMQNRALFLVWERLSLPTLGVFTFIQYLLARFWIRADLINSSFPLPFLPFRRCPLAPGCSLLSAQSPALPVPPSCLSTPFPGDMCGSEGLEFPNSHSLCVSTESFASYHTMTCWEFFFFF